MGSLKKNNTLVSHPVFKFQITSKPLCMKKWILPILLMACISITYYISLPQEKEIEEFSGAYHALSFFGDARMYPEKHLPENAYFTAWKKAKKMSEAQSLSRNVDPWESMGPHNRGGRTLGLAFNPQNENTLYAGSASGGLWRSYTAGEGINAWQRVDVGYPVLGVSCIEIMPEDTLDMFIGTGEVYNYFAAGTGAAYRSTRGSYGIGILRSTDGGTTWAPSLDFSYDQNKGIWDIEIAPSNHDIIYAATTDGVYKSTDGGDSWNLVLDVVMANDIVVHPDDADLVAVGCGNFASEGFGIYRTDNGGSSWYKINQGLPVFYEGKIQMAIAPSDPMIIYASIGNGFSSATGASWLCRSEDFGNTWEIRNTTDYSKWQGWFSHDVAVNPTDPDDITVIGIELWRSSDGGTTLVQKSTGGAGFNNPPIAGADGNPDYIHSDIHEVIYHPTDPNTIYTGSDGGVHRTQDGGETFLGLNARYQTAQFYNGFSNSYQDPNFCQGGLQDNGSIQWNGPDVDGGVTWTRVFGGDGSWSAVDPDNDDINYVSWQRLNVQKTTNGNTGYSSLGVPLDGESSFIAPFLVAPSNGQVIFAGSEAIARSDDGGNNWVVGPNLDGNPALSMSMSSQNTDVVYVGTAPNNGNPAGIHVTTDGGASWTEVTTSDLPDRYPMDIQVDPTNDAVAYVTYSGYNTGHVFRTDDFGENWTDVSEDLPNVPANAVEVDPLFPNNVYVGTDIGIYVSTDWGATWESFGEGLPNATMAFDLKISPAARKLRVATHGLGAYQRDLLEEPFVSSVSEAKEQLKLNVFPNPIVESATINYELSESSDVQIDLLDNSGKLVNNIFTGKQFSGDNTHNFSVNDYPNGIYYLRINTGKFTTTEKLFISK